MGTHIYDNTFVMIPINIDIVQTQAGYVRILIVEIAERRVSIDSFCKT